MIERYTRPEMGQIWSAHSRFEFLLQVEIAVAQVQSEMGIIPAEAAAEISARAKFSVERIDEIEKETKHDVIAFVSNLAETVGPLGKFIHYGMTSSDVLDTALSLQIQRAGVLVESSLNSVLKVLKEISLRESGTLCLGRTHGMAAEPTTFGYKMCGYVEEFQRGKRRLQQALEQIRICKLSGAVGTYSNQSESVERAVAQKLGLQCEDLATQVVPRDRHAEVFTALAFVMSAVERLAVELRHLQRSEVAEVTEGFSRGQKGSSAMPHKKNPISAENLTGLSRMVRSYLTAAFENIVLWHERDISHSSVERVFLPDVFILVDYGLHRLSQLLSGLEIHRDRMIQNLESTRGLVMSSQLLLELVKKGWSREAAYTYVQKMCHSLKANQHLKDSVLADEQGKSLFSSNDLQRIFSGESLRKSLADRVEQRFSAPKKETKIK